MTLADLHEIDLDDRAYCMIVAAARRARPRVSPRTMLERVIDAIANPRETAVLWCSSCDRPTHHVHEADARTPMTHGDHVSPMWSCRACGYRRQFGGGLVIKEPAP